MAYTKFEFFDNPGQGNGTIPDYGSAPRTFEGDLALVTQSPEYSCLRRINAQVQNDEGNYFDVTIWVGLLAGKESTLTQNLTKDDVTEFAAVPCPPYIHELIFFDKEGLLSRLP